MPINFQNGKIYSIRSPNTDQIYIGSTTQPLSKRMAKHRATSNGTKSRTLIQAGDAYIELIENYPCADRNELLRREGQLIRSTPNTVNHNVAGRTRAEYRQDNRAQKNAYLKVYASARIQCPCGASIRRGDRSQHLRSAKHRFYETTLEFIYS